MNRNTYDLACKVLDGSDEVTVKQLAEAVMWEKNPSYKPAEWVYTGHYGVCSQCGTYLRGCGVAVPAPLTVPPKLDQVICPDCDKDEK